MEMAIGQECGNYQQLKSLNAEIFFSYLTSFFCSFFSQDKENISELEVQYDFSFVRDTADTDQSHRSKELMILDLNANSSVFFSKQYMAAGEFVKRKIIEAQTSPNVEIRTADLPKYKVGYTVYRNGSQIYVTGNISLDFFTFENTYLKWNTDYTETKTILGYQCHKATTIFGKRLFTAWYTKDIPISEGPYRFKG